MSTYTMEEGFLTIEDPELNLFVKEAHSPLKIPFPLSLEKDLQDIASRHTLRVIKGKRNKIIEAYIEKDGLKNGQCLVFHPDGSIKQESFYTEGKLHGFSVFYGLQQQVLTKSWFIRDQQEGRSHWYYAEGPLYCIQRFRNGLWENKQEYFYPDGKLKTLMNYSQGKLHGTSIEYSPEGSVKLQVEFANGKRLPS